MADKVTIFSASRSNLVEGQTSFTIPGGYTAGQADVYLNGIRLVPPDDVTVTSGKTVVLLAPAAVGDILHIMSR